MIRTSDATSAKASGRSTLGFAIVLLISTAASAWAQTERGSIRGTILDPSDAVVPGVAVTATNVATGVVSVTESTSAGVYNFPVLPSGTYRVEVIHPGFKTAVRENVRVSAANVTSLNVTLQLGEASETVEVSAQAPLLRSETSSTGASVDSQAFIQLPLPSSGGGRRANSFMLLVPGVALRGSGGSFLDSVSGGQASSMEIQLEGASMVTAEITGDGRSISFPPDVVEEMSVATSTYTAEYGNLGGGLQRYVLRSGSNQFHGSVYEFFQHEALDARGFFDIVRPVHREHEFGGTIGGPVFIPGVYDGKNRTFFYFGFNGYNFDTVDQTRIISVPTQAFRSGDLSAWPQQIYDPATTRPDPNNPTQFIRDPFPGNIIPADRIHPITKRIVDFYPLPNRPGTFNNYAALVPAQTANRRIYTFKGDHLLTPNHRVSVSYVQTYKPRTTHSALPYPIGGETLFYDRLRFGRTAYDWTITPNIVNQFRVAYNFWQGSPRPETRFDSWPQQLGLTGMELGAGAFPSIGIGSFAGTGLSTHADRRSVTYTISDALSWTKGAHNLKFGFEARRMDAPFAIPEQNAVSLNFSRNQTALPGRLGTTGLEFASFLLGQVNRGSVPLRGGFRPNVRTHQLGLYAQDDFKVTSRLTLNYGLRYEMFTPITDRNDLYGIVDVTKPNPFAGNLPGVYVWAGQGGVGSRIPPADKNSHNFGPRVGLAYRLNDKTVVRSGYGMSYFQTGAYGAGSNIRFADGYWITSAAESLDQLSAAYTLAAGFPVSALVIPPNLDPGLGVGTATSVSYWHPTAGRASRSQNWNVTVQRQLADTMSVEAGYVGSKATNLPAPLDINQLDPQYFSLGASLLNSNINSSAVVATGFKPPYPGFNGTLAQALRPFPQYINMTGRNSANIGRSSYHALHVRLDRRLAGGLYGNVAYTWVPHWLTDAPSSFTIFSPAWRNLYDRSMNMTHPVAADVVLHHPHALAIGFSYELPFGPNKPMLSGGGVWSALFGGWQVSGLLRYESGDYLGVRAPQTNPTYGSIPQTADRVPGVAVRGSWDRDFDPATDRWVNADAFTLPAGVFGNTPLLIDDLTGPAFLNEDLSLSKRIRVVGQVNLEFRVEAFNVFNRRLLANPATNLGNLATFGRITGTRGGPRTGQLAVKLTF